MLKYAMDAYKGKGNSEASLLRSIGDDGIEKNDIVLGDAYFPSFFIMADLMRKKADGIFRGQGQRHYDFRTGKRLGKNDHLIDWKKPLQKPAWMNHSDYDSYPNKMTVREFQVNDVICVTTFHSKTYHKKELAEIYKMRWHVELNLRSIKATMRMDMLSCKTPDMVKKEVGMHFLAYNIIRVIMGGACMKHGSLPWKISFKGAMQLVNVSTSYFLSKTKVNNATLYMQMTEWIVKNKVGNRPGRVEPRAVKQRKKAFSLLKQSRDIDKEKLIKKS